MTNRFTHPSPLVLLQVAVRATGLNFRDVLNVLGMYPGDPGPPGGDCAGVVMQTGAGVQGLRAGKVAMCGQMHKSFP